ncbi:hypothetical protein MYX04_15480, partial [Nitrospiraceae bacterium AH_259_D15_M11_P09]|nr:hypothetical protein [Nitrospiraceae bacterium AH_259_D15_M11_P09]
VRSDELAQDLADAGGGPQASAHGHSESNRPVLAASGEQADVVDGSQGAVVAAARERNLKFPREALV